MLTDGRTDGLGDSNSLSQIGWLGAKNDKLVFSTFKVEHLMGKI